MKNILEVILSAKTNTWKLLQIKYFITYFWSPVITILYPQWSILDIAKNSGKHEY